MQKRVQKKQHGGAKCLAPGHQGWYMAIELLCSLRPQQSLTELYRILTIVDNGVVKAGESHEGHDGR